MASGDATIAAYRTRANAHIESDRNGTNNANTSEFHADTGRRSTTRQSTMMEYQNQSTGHLELCNIFL